MEIRPSVKLQAANVLIMSIFRSQARRILSAVVSILIRLMMWGRRIVRAAPAKSFYRIGHVLVVKSTASIKLYLLEMEKAALNLYIRLRGKSQVLAACLIESTGMRKP